MNPKINQTVLMSGANYFGDSQAINVLMDASLPVDLASAKAEHAQIQSALESAGLKVIKIDAPAGLQDGVYVANWALIRSGKALMSRLPNTRRPEEAYALKAIKNAGLEPLILPSQVERFSGQGDSLPCGDIVFTQSPFRTTIKAHQYLKDWLGFSEVIALETEPARDASGQAIINAVTGWPDSPTYDIDLALAILKWPGKTQKGLIAYCPEVFKPASQKLLADLNAVDKITVSKTEALESFALNLVSTGETVVMNAGAPNFQAALESDGLKTIALNLPELRKGGGSIRCTTLTL
ncbi:MAG: dimethylarginine dimethylaminohydrolase family protein [Candidatus Saccharimonadales bacterium]